MEKSKMSVSAFLSAASAGLARPNKYEIELTLPPGIQSAWDGVSLNSTAGVIGSVGMRLNSNGALNMMCHTVTMPQRSLMTTDLRQYGSPYKVPHSQSYDTIALSFYARPELQERKFFETWQQTVVNITSNTMNFYYEYVSDVKIHQLDAKGNRTYSIIAYEAYPLSVGVVDYSYSSMNAIQNITAVLTFKHWKNAEFDGHS